MLDYREGTASTRKFQAQQKPVAEFPAAAAAGLCEALQLLRGFPVDHCHDGYGNDWQNYGKNPGKMVVSRWFHGIY